ncbi:ECF transporter S component [Alkalibacter mobilis]|uniref:ECF transporter S component n=1 Tax=Alkalibacter mobilis TaxID=2787712 RepID=UPI00189FE963|nr:ECF transporter S component [Alkalibacter mobilis]MBF7096810.1 ECF transporter S component [Alkalibacter mobilis]
MSREVEFITKTGLLLALALVIQIGLAPFAQPVVGPLINMLLILSVILVGPWGAVVVGSLTPIIAFLVGIMGLFPVVPVIILGNCAYSLVFWVFGRKNRIIGLIIAAVLKFIVLAGGVRLLAMFFMPNLPAPVIATLSLPQLYTALVGGSVALLVVHYLPKRMVE